MWEVLGERAQLIAFMYLFGSLLYHPSARQGLSLTAMRGLVLIQFLRLDAPWRVSRYNEIGWTSDVPTFVMVVLCTYKARPFEVDVQPFGIEVLVSCWSRFSQMSHGIQQTLSLIFFLMICAFIGAIYHIFGATAVAQDDVELGFGQFRSYCSQVHLVMDGLVLLPQAVHIRRCGGPVPPVLANFLGILSCSRIFFAISAAGLFLQEMWDAEFDAKELYYALTQLSNLAIFADFFVYFVRSKRNGGKFELPS